MPAVHLLCKKKHMYVRQKRPLSLYIYATNDLFSPRGADVACGTPHTSKETYIYVKRGLHV